MPEEMLEVVDESGRVLGIKGRGEISRDGLLHRAVYVVLLDSDGSVLLQRRSASKHYAPNCWDIVLVEHPHLRESYEDSARRGLSEELGVEGIPLTRIREAMVYPNEHGRRRHPEFAEMYRGTYDGAVRPNSDEVSEARFFSQEEIERILAEGSVTDHFARDWRWMKENLPELKEK